jgi:hypothetical protein
MTEKKTGKTAEEEKAKILRAIKYQRGRLEILDQLQLPHRTVYEEVKTRRDAWDAIRKMRVRGAPAIAIVAVLAVAVEVDALLQAAPPPPPPPPSPSPSTSTAHLQTSPSSTGPPPPSASTVHDFICESLEYLLSSRPTAVNLADAVAKLKALLHDVRSRAARVETPLSGADVANAYIAAAERMLDDDVRDNEAIGRHGAEWIRKHVVAAAAATGTGQEAAGVRVVTHCNTGYGIRIGCGSIFYSPIYLYHSALQRVYKVIKRKEQELHALLLLSFRAQLLRRRMNSTSFTCRPFFFPQFGGSLVAVDDSLFFGSSLQQIPRHSRLRHRPGRHPCSARLICP